MHIRMHIHMQVPRAMEADTNAAVLKAMVERVMAKSVRRKLSGKIVCGFCLLDLR